MTVDYAHSASATAARTIKADRLAEQIRAEGLGAAAASTLTDNARRRVEKAAGIRPASDETWALALAFVADHEQAHRLNPPPVHHDPDDTVMVEAVLTWLGLTGPDLDPEVAANAAVALGSLLGHAVSDRDVADAVDVRYREQACLEGGDVGLSLVEGAQGSLSAALDGEAARYGLAYVALRNRIVGSR